MHIVEENTLKPRALEKINFVPNKRRSVYMRLYGSCLIQKVSVQMIVFYIFHGPLQPQKLEDNGKCHIKVLVICKHFPACTAITYTCICTSSM